MHVGEFPIRIKSTLNSFSFRISEFVRHTSRNLFSSKHVWPLSLMWFLLLYNMNFFWKIRLFSDDFFLASKGSLIFHQARYRSKCDDRPRWTVEDFFFAAATAKRAAFIRRWPRSIWDVRSSRSVPVSVCAGRRSSSAPLPAPVSIVSACGRRWRRYLMKVFGRRIMDRLGP